MARSASRVSGSTRHQSAVTGKKASGSVQYYLRVVGHTNATVEVVARAPARDGGFAGRLSPIFPLHPSIRQWVPKKGQSYAIYFCYSRAPAPALAVLESKLGVTPTVSASNPLKHVWYSLGLANIIVLAPDGGESDEASARQLLDCLEKTAGFTGYERWRVVGGALQSEPYSTVLPVAGPPLLIDPYDDLTETFVDGLDEAVSMLTSVVSHASTYTPDNVDIFESLGPHINDLIGEVRRLQGQRSLDAQEQLLSQQDSLVQLYSALAYVDSQCFSGTSPILFHPAQIRPFSLLGVGSAVVGAQAVVRFITEAFNQSRVYGCVRDDYPEEGPRGPYTSLNSSIAIQFDPDAQLDEILRPHRLDRHDLHVPAVPSQPTIVHFSARRGFMQSEWCITIPTQSILRGANTEWSIQTLTHEQMHSHQDALISIMRNTLLRYVPEANGHLAEGVSQVLDEWDLLETLVHGHTDLPSIPISVYIFCQLAVILKRLDYATIVYQIVSDDAELLSRAHPQNLFDRYDHDLREWMVHTLDISYFYSSEETEYVKSIWKTWSTVPKVFLRCREYLLRTLLAMGTCRAGIAEDRFDDAVAVLKTALGKPPKEEPSGESTNDLLELLDEVPTSTTPGSASTMHVLMDQVLGILESHEERARLFADFALRIPICDLTRALLVSEDLSAKLQSDREQGDEGAPRIAHGAFDLQPVSNPIVFLRSITQASSLSDQQLSAWMYLHLMSSRRFAS